MAKEIPSLDNVKQKYYLSANDL